MPTIPLRAFSPELPDGCGWFAELESESAAMLIQLDRQACRFEVSSAEGANLVGSVQLSADEFRDAQGVSRVSITVTEVGETPQMVWSGTVASAMSGGRLEPVDFTVPVPAGPGVVVAFHAEADGSVLLQPIRRVVWRHLGLTIANSESARSNGESGGWPNVWARFKELQHHDEKPLFSIVMPVCDPEPELLRTTVESIYDQTYPHWELCITDDASTDQRVIEMLNQMVEQRPSQIKVHTNPVRSGIAASTNSATALASGEYVALLDHDDLLKPRSLQVCAEAAIANDHPDMIYTNDEVWMGSGQVSTSLKPGWSPDMLRSIMYTGHLVAYKRDKMLQVDGLRSNFDGSQDYDLVLRIIESGASVVHVPEVAYTWRAHSGSMAGNPHSKPLAYPRALKAINEHISRTGIGGRAVYGRARGHYHHLPNDLGAAPAVAIICGIDSSCLEYADELKKAIVSWSTADLTPSELIFVFEEVNEPLARQVLIDAVRESNFAGTLRFALVDDLAPGNFVDAVNQAASSSTSDVLAVMQRPVVRLSHIWLGSLAGFALQNDVQAAGTRIIAADGQLEAAGVSLLAGVPLRLFAGGQGWDHGPAGIARHTRSVSAHHDFVVLARERLRAMGGLRREFGALSLVDFCLRGAEQGKRTVFLGDLLSARPAGSVVGGPTLDELAIAQATWLEHQEKLTPAGLTEATTMVSLPEFARPA